MNNKLMELINNPHLIIGKRGEGLDLRKLHRYTGNQYMPNYQQPQKKEVKHIKETPTEDENLSLEGLLDEIKSMDKKPTINILRKKIKGVMDKQNEDEL